MARQHPKWKPPARGSCRSSGRSLGRQAGAAFPSPFQSLAVEPNNRRTRVLSLNERAEIFAAIKDEQFREFVQAMFETGCRPGEVASVTAADADLNLGVWVLQKHKTAKKTKKPRVIYLTPAMVELTRKLMAKNTEGPLFEVLAGRSRSPVTASAAASGGSGRSSRT